MMQDAFLPLSDWQGGHLSARLDQAAKTLGKPRAGSAEKTGRLKAACAELESLFVYELLKVMRNTIPKSGLLDGGQAEETYTAMMDEELSRHIALRGDLGIASMLMEHLGGQSVEEHAKKNENENEK